MNDQQQPCRWPAKVQYATSSAAAAHRRGMIRGGAKPGTLAVYPCGEHWHLGNTRRYALPEQRTPGRAYARRPADARRGRRAR